MNRGYCVKSWKFFGQKWANHLVGASEILSLYHGKVKVGFWPSVAKWSMGRCLISTKVNLRHSQTTKRSITDHFSINKIHQGPFQTCLTEKIQEFEDFGLLAGWVKMSPKETSPGHLLNNTRANQTSKWTNTYPTNDNQSHLGAFRHIRPTLKNQNFWLFGHWVVGCSEVNYELLSRSPRLKPSDIIWMDSVEPEYEVSDAKDGRVQLRGLNES